jgi:hypothetical protein
MTVLVPTTRTILTGLPIRPGGKVVDSTWETMAANAHLAYARGSVRIPLYWSEDGISASSASYIQPAPLDGITAVWRPTRVTIGARYRITLHVYGVDADVRATLYDATVGGGGSLGTEVASCGGTAEWATAAIAVQDTDALDGSGDPIPLGLSLEIKTSASIAEVYAIHAVATILTSATLP